MLDRIAQVPARHAAAYIHYSADRHPHQPLSRQRLLCREFAKNNQMKLVSIYEEPLDSSEQVVLRRLIADASAGAFTHVIVFNLDTIARDTATLAKQLALLAQARVLVLPIVRFMPEDDERLILQAFLRRQAAVELPDTTQLFPFYCLEGRLHCDRCASQMVGVIINGQQGYACTNSTCHKAAEDATALEQFLAEETLRLLLTPFNIAELSRRVSVAYRREYGAKLYPPRAVRAWLESLRGVNLAETDVRHFILYSFLRYAYIADNRVAILLNMCFPNRADGMMANPLPKLSGDTDDGTIMY